MRSKDTFAYNKPKEYVRRDKIALLEKLLGKIDRIMSALGI